jgi:release factor glutamine methyltransferase
MQKLFHIARRKTIQSSCVLECNYSTSSLRSLVRWGDEYISKHMNQQSLHSHEYESAITDYHDESMQLLAHSLSVDYQTAKQYVYLNNNKNSFVTKEQMEQYKHLIKQRAEKKVPIQYLIGNCEFYGREFHVNGYTLIPRSDSETLIDAVMEKIESILVDNNEHCIRILDIGTGSGCLIITLLCELQKKHINASGVAMDISSGALDMAIYNANQLLSSPEVLSFIQQDVLQLNKANTLNLEAFDLVISNPPYISSETIPKLSEEVKDHEPLSALDGGQDGLVFYRAITKLCDEWLLKPGGMLVYEIGYDQAKSVQEIINNSENLTACNIYKDLSQNDRVVSTVYQKSTIHK